MSNELDLHARIDTTMFAGTMFVWVSIKFGCLQLASLALGDRGRRRSPTNTLDDARV